MSQVHTHTARSAWWSAAVALVGTFCVLTALLAATWAGGLIPAPLRVGLHWTTDAAMLALALIGLLLQRDWGWRMAPLAAVPSVAFYLCAERWQGAAIMASVAVVGLGGLADSGVARRSGVGFWVILALLTLWSGAMGLRV